jgi:uncharacterized protein (TIGR00730 family)
MGKEKYNLPASKLPIEPDETTTGDFRSSFHWRIFRILSEFTEGWQFLADLKKSVTFFGSARFSENDHWYQEARELGYMLAKDGIDIITGGGPGIMEAGNRGAHDANAEYEQDNPKIGNSIGLNIKLPQEQRVNPYVDKSVAFHYFFVRKVMLSYYAQAYVYFPGGYGTLDEFFELATLIQTKKIGKIPLVLVGKEFWEPLNDFIKNYLLDKFSAIDKEDLDLYKIVDSAEEAYQIIKSVPDRKSF